MAKKQEIPFHATVPLNRDVVPWIINTAVSENRQNSCLIVVPCTNLKKNALCVVGEDAKWRKNK
jgi:hypothetical protein